jgi:hypothetical protein
MPQTAKDQSAKRHGVASPGGIAFIEPKRPRRADRGAWSVCPSRTRKYSLVPRATLQQRDRQNLYRSPQ